MNSWNNFSEKYTVKNINNSISELSNLFLPDFNIPECTEPDEKTGKGVNYAYYSNTGKMQLTLQWKTRLSTIKFEKDDPNTLPIQGVADTRQDIDKMVVYQWILKALEAVIRSEGLEFDQIILLQKIQQENNSPLQIVVGYNWLDFEWNKEKDSETAKTRQELLGKLNKRVPKEMIPTLKWENNYCFLEAQDEPFDACVNLWKNLSIIIDVKDGVMPESMTDDKKQKEFYELMLSNIHEHLSRIPYFTETQNITNEFREKLLKKIIKK